MGHLVTGGTLANIESMWAARNVKYYPLGLKDAIINEDVLANARKDFTVFLPAKDKNVRILEATNWELLNLDVDEIISMPDKVGTIQFFPPKVELVSSARIVLECQKI